jgi:RNA polymerase sigma-70 factor, ECF subfamily
VTTRGNPAGDDDDALMRQAADGDTDAFGHIVARYQGRLTRFAARMLGGDADAAQDMVQEAFLRLWQSRSRYAAQGNLDRYLLRVVHNLCIDDQRRRSRHSDEPLETGPENAVGVPGPEEKAQAVSLADAVREAVSRLPDEQRAVFILSHYEGMCYQDIADALGCPLGTVASRKHLAAQALRRALKPWIEE